jgi:hypothetical protein
VNNATDKFTCTGGGSGWNHGWIGGLAEQVCTASNPCNANADVPGSSVTWVGLTSCAGATRWGTGDAMVLGADSLKIGSCNATRGAGPTCDTPDTGVDPGGDPCPTLYGLYVKNAKDCCTADPSLFVCKGDTSPFLAGCEKQWATTDACKQALRTLTSCVQTSTAAPCSDAKKLVFSGCETEYQAWTSSCP